MLFGTYAHADHLVWHSGFENGYPGHEWLDLGRGAYSSDGAMPEGLVSAWTIVDHLTGEPVLSGNHAYKGWIEGVASPLKGKSVIQILRKFGARQKNFTGEHFWARGYFVSTVGLDENMVRTYIRNQEDEDERYDQMKLEMG